MPTVAPADGPATPMPSGSAVSAAIDGGRANRRLLLARLAWFGTVAFVAILFIGGAAIIHRQISMPCSGGGCQPWQRHPSSGVPLPFYATWYVAREAFFLLCFCVIAGVMVWKAGDDETVTLGALSMVLFAGSTYADSVDALGQSGPVWRWIVAGAGCVGSASFFVFLFLFPDGRFVPRWSRIGSAAWAALSAVAYAAPRGSVVNAHGSAYFLTVFGVAGGVVMAQIQRYRRASTPIQRQQTKWVIYGVATAFAGLFVSALLFPMIGSDIIPNREFYTLTGMTVAAAFLLLIPLSIGVAMIRFRLWDVDLLVNRTLVYGLLTATVAGLYALLVAGAGALIPGSRASLGSFLAAGLIAVLFQPIRTRLQRGVNRLLYGDRDDPYAVLSRLGERLGGALTHDAVLPTITETVAQALRLPYAAITVLRHNQMAIGSCYGSPVANPTVWPLLHQGEPVGELLLGPRSTGEAFGSADRKLLDDLARQAGVAVHALQLTADLQRSRERLVGAREEERRRLRRDLHDGLGPHLASQTLTLDAARTLMPSDPVAADRLLDELRGHIQSAVADIRHLVYELRPPALDDLGLAATLSDGARRYHDAGVRIEIDVPEPLPPLPAAVEVAAYRIVQEALTNVVRHAGAATCVVSMRHDEGAGQLRVEISDDGRGFPSSHRAGVGLASMRERATELGGSWAIESRPLEGTRIRARLPLAEAS